MQVCVLSILVVVFGSSLNPLQALLLIMLPCQPIRLQVYGIPTCPAVQTPVEDESYSVSVSVTWLQGGEPLWVKCDGAESNGACDEVVL